MDITILPGHLQGHLRIVPSKSQAHRLLICAAFADQATNLLCPETNQDMDATAGCLRSLGAEITKSETGYRIRPISRLPQQAILDCGESGSTLRFLLPVAGALGVDATFQLSGRLPQRPLSPLWEEMERMGCRLSRPTGDTIRCQGQLKSGDYFIDGGVSSQFITGLLFAAALMDGESRIHITGKLESRPYIAMTQETLRIFGIDTTGSRVPGGQVFRSPGEIAVEGDWSNGAFFMAANYLGSDVMIEGLSPLSAQGDRAAADLLPRLLERQTIPAEDIPDLVPILSVVAGAKKGATFTGIRRLRLKESDRVATVSAMLAALGIRTESGADFLAVYPGTFHGGTVDAAGDHRIAMSAAIAATIASGPVTLLGAQCVSKSYPRFWEEFSRLGGNYEQHLR